MAYTLVNLGTDTNDVRRPQDYTLVFVGAPELMPTPQRQHIYITEFNESSIQYQLLNAKGELASGRVYAAGSHPVASFTRNTARLIFKQIPPLYIPVEQFERTQLEFYKLAILDIAAAKGRADKVEYPRGETLSFINRRIASSHDLVEGPNTLGTNVGEKIAEGVFKLLVAIHKGETTFNIVAHSRGAIESIIIAHEIERIRNAATSEASLIKILQDTPCDYTRAAYNRLAMPVEINDLLPQFSSISMNLFLIDPVPGDSDNYILLDRINWKDLRMFKIPSIVRDVQIIIMNNEQSRFFKAVIPSVQNESTTQLRIIRLPGHHGTASGNPFDQCMTRTLRKINTWDVQSLVLTEIASFLSVHEVTFKKQEVVSAPYMRTNDTDESLDEVLYQFLEAEPSVRDEILLERYQKVKSNEDFYNAFDRTAYVSPWLRTRTLHWPPATRTGSRTVFYLQWNDYPLCKVPVHQLIPEHAASLARRSTAALQYNTVLATRACAPWSSNVLGAAHHLNWPASSVRHPRIMYPTVLATQLRIQNTEAPLVIQSPTLNHVSDVLEVVPSVMRQRMNVFQGLHYTQASPLLLIMWRNHGVSASLAHTDSQMQLTVAPQYNMGLVELAHASWTNNGLEAIIHVNWSASRARKPSTMHLIESPTQSAPENIQLPLVTHSIAPNKVSPFFAVAPSAMKQIEWHNNRVEASPYIDRSLNSNSRDTIPIHGINPLTTKPDLKRAVGSKNKKKGPVEPLLEPIEGGSKNQNQNSSTSSFEQIDEGLKNKDQVSSMPSFKRIQTLCQTYMDYALDKLGHSKQNRQYVAVLSSTDQLSRKYNIAARIYHLVDKNQATVKSIKDILDKPETKSLLGTHRNGVFVRLIAAIGQWLSHLFSPVPGNKDRFFKSAKSDALRKDLVDALRGVVKMAK